MAYKGSMDGGHTVISSKPDEPMVTIPLSVAQRLRATPDRSGGLTDEEWRMDFVAQAEHIRNEHEATHGEAEQCGAECVVLGLTEGEPAPGLDVAARTVVEMERLRRGLTASHQTMSAHDHDRCIREAEFAVRESIDALDAALSGASRESSTAHPEEGS